VPLLIYDPRAKGNGKACARTVELVDLLATLAGLAGLEAPKTDGANLVPLLADPTAKWERPAVTQVTRGGAKAPFMGYTVRDERYRYTEWDGGKKGVQLHDLEKDPGELKNLADDPAHAETVKRLKALLPKKAAG
jgi:uncharacterized sulfatase